MLGLASALPSVGCAAVAQPATASHSCTSMSSRASHTSVIVCVVGRWLWVVQAQAPPMVRLRCRRLWDCAGTLLSLLWQARLVTATATGGGAEWWLVPWQAVPVHRSRNCAWHSQALAEAAVVAHCQLWYAVGAWKSSLSAQECGVVCGCMDVHMPWPMHAALSLSVHVCQQGQAWARLWFAQCTVPAGSAQACWGPRLHVEG